MAWLPISMPIVFRNKPWLIFAVLAPAELLLIFLVNLLGVASGGGWWFLSYALPTYILSVGVAIAAAVLVAISKVKGLNIAGVLLAAAAIECLGLEVILDLAGGAGLSLTWSPVVVLACVPASGLAFYFHYRIMKKPLARKLHV
jgi:hypothetical protein